MTHLDHGVGSVKMEVNLCSHVYTSLTNKALDKVDYISLYISIMLLNIGHLLLA